jgi:thiol-disulfide isomerase/thioredoxin
VGLRIGTDLPPATLVTLDGVEATLGDAITEPTVLLFWNPGCGFCRSLHDDITTWERERTADDPALVVISAGTAEAVRSEGFASHVLLDPDWSVSSTLGADGTPMALLVDASGRVASSAVAGDSAVLELLGTRTLSAA